MQVLQRLKERSQAIRSEIVALYLSYRDSRTPWLPKLLIVLTVAYALSPVDLIPDFIPVLGYLDDLIILPLLITIAIKLIPYKVMADSRLKAREYNMIGKKAGTFAAAFIVLIWIVILIFILMRILK